MRGWVLVGSEHNWVIWETDWCREGGSFDWLSADCSARRVIYFSRLPPTLIQKVPSCACEYLSDLHDVPD
ncbi:hypothetical protein GCM10027423_31700 [Spirosoma arcticum]